MWNLGSTADLQVSLLFEPTTAAARRGELPSTKATDNFEVEVLLVYTASTLVVIILAICLFLLLPCCMWFGHRHSNRMYDTPLPVDYWVRHAKRWRFRHPRWENPWIQVCPWDGSQEGQSSIRTSRRGGDCR